jgi:hypothetical protein
MASKVTTRVQLVKLEGKKDRTDQKEWTVPVLNLENQLGLGQQEVNE